MDIMLVCVSLMIAFCMVVTTLAAIGFLVFLFLLTMESYEKKKLSPHVLSDFISPETRCVR